MTKDYLYKKAPLVEVIAEIHWALKKLDTGPDTRIDPFYDLFREQFLESAKESGFGHQQELIPQMVPIELVADQPHIRIRQKAESWPLIQIGPGILTANIVPPYQGWQAFEPFLAESVARLFDAYPVAKKTLRIERLHLRYVDGFDESFGLDSYTDFASEKLGIAGTLPTALLETHVLDKSKATFVVENRFQNKSPEGSLGNIKLSPGKVHGRDAAVLELRCESRFSDEKAREKATDIDFIMGWFAEAHKTLRGQFEDLSTEALKQVMGERVEIGED
jgi:uncharacterized protein (TIGR04255 family)